MPAAKHQYTISRQWDILRLLPSHSPGITTTDLQTKLEEKGHQVSKRTVERDMEQLAALFHEIKCNDRSKPYGWHWFRGKLIEFPGMDLSEAMSLGLLESVMKQLFPTHLIKGMENRFELAEQFLQQQTDNPNAHWNDLVHYETPGLPLHPPSFDPDILENIRRALLEKRRVCITYQSRSSQETSLHELSPLALIVQGTRPYLVACSETTKPRFYALQRIQTIRLLNTPTSPPDNFTIQSFLQAGGTHFGERKPITLKATINQVLSDLLTETPLSSDQKLVVRKGVIHLTASVTWSWPLELWIRSQGPNITVKQPASLRRRIIEKLNSTLANYES